MPIEAIEVVRIRPQQQPRASRSRALIEDPWRRFECAPDPAGCTVELRGPRVPASGRDAVYYVRALQEPTPAINGANLRTRFDADGNAIVGRALLRRRAHGIGRRLPGARAASARGRRRSSSISAP